MDTKKILIIEDDADIRRTIEVRLAMEGFTVITAADGKEGLEKAIAENAGLLILDLKLPGLPGEEVCRELRRTKGLERLPVIMLTAKDTDVDMVIGKVVGADLYMRKPFDIEELLVNIRSLLSRR